MTTNDLGAIRELVARHTATIGPGGEKAWTAGRLAARVPALCDEVEQLRATANVRQGQLKTAREHADKATAELAQLRGEHQVLERLVMDAVIATPLPADADAVIAARPVLPYRSATVDGLSGVTVNGVDGQVVIDGLAHTPAAALELSAAIARAVRETTLGGCRG